MTTANPYEVGVAYIDGKPLEPLGKVERFDVVEEPDYTGPSRAIMDEALRGGHARALRPVLLRGRLRDHPLLRP